MSVSKTTTRLANGLARLWHRFGYSATPQIYLFEVLHLGQVFDAIIRYIRVPQVQVG